MVDPKVIETLEAALAESIEREKDILERLSAAQACKAAFETVLASLAPKTDTHTMGQGPHSHIEASQLQTCRNQIEAWERIAELSGGVVRPNESAQLIISAGLTRQGTTKRSVVSTGSTHMTKSDHWERTAPGTFRWLLYEEPQDQAHEPPADDSPLQPDHTAIADATPPADQESQPDERLPEIQESAPVWTWQNSDVPSTSA